MVMIRAEGKPKKIADKVLKKKNVKPPNTHKEKFKLTQPYLQH